MCTTIRPKIKALIDIYLSFAHDHSTEIYDLLYFVYSFFVHDHSTKIRVLINLFFYLYTTIRPKLGVTLTLKFVFFLIVPIICLQHCLYISPATIIPLYFVDYINRRISYSYISYVISMAIWSLSPLLWFVALFCWYFM